MRFFLTTVAALAFLGTVSGTANSISPIARYTDGVSGPGDLFITSPWPTEPADDFCDRPIQDDSKAAECCIAVNGNLPGTHYGQCTSSTSHNCPGTGTKKTCTASAGNGGCPDGVAVDGVYPKCQMAYDSCVKSAVNDNKIHCWGTLQCYSDPAGTVLSSCPAGGIVYNGDTVFHQGDFCYEAGASGISSWCGRPACEEGSSTEDCECPAPFIIEDGICCAPFPGTNSCQGPAGGQGDPQIGGFHGQSFQFHGLADEVFNLISTPSLQVNGHFVYLSSGKCDYNDTMCWSHPGTYIDQLGLSFGSHQIKLVAGTHQVGLHVFIDGERISYGNYQLQANGTMVAIKFHHHGSIFIKTHEFSFTIYNSDMFFNLEASLLDQRLLHIGAPKHTITDSTLCKKEENVDETKFQTSEIKHKHNHGAVEAAIEKKYGGIQIPLHGLIGQTWRNVLVCGKNWVGAVTDYVCSDLFASDYFFNFYRPE